METIEAPCAPTQNEIDRVDTGINDRLVDAAAEPLHPDPVIAAFQADRDRCAARGDFDRAEHLADRVDALRAYQARRQAEGRERA